MVILESAEINLFIQSKHELLNKMLEEIESINQQLDFLNEQLQALQWNDQCLKEPNFTLQNKPNLLQTNLLTILNQHFPMKSNWLKNLHLAKPCKKPPVVPADQSGKHPSIRLFLFF